MAKQTIQRVEKPWGYELIWAKTKDYVGKVLHINKGHKLSLQYHRQKEETIFISSGKMNLIFENEKGEMQEIPAKLITSRLGASTAWSRSKIRMFAKSRLRSSTTWFVLKTATAAAEIELRNVRSSLSRDHGWRKRNALLAEEHFS
jgi:uncharacterized protein YndB with AHSA1/START domain